MGESPQHSVLQNDTELDNIFHVLDEENVGYITVEKFTTALNSFIPNELALDKLNTLLDKLDPQNDGKIYLNDFRKAISRLQFITEDLASSSLRVSSNTGSSNVATPTGENADEAVALKSGIGGGVGHHRRDDSWSATTAAVDSLDCAIMQHDDDAADWQAAAAGNASNGRADEESFEDWGSSDLGGPAGFLIDFGSSQTSTPGEGAAAAVGGLAVKPPLPPDAAQAQLERGTEVRGTWPRHRPRPDTIKLNVPSRSPSLRSPHPSRRPSRTGALITGLHRPPSATQLAQQLYSTSSGRSSPRTSGDGMFYDEADYPDPGMYSDEMKSTLKLLNDRIEQLSNSVSMSDTRHNKLMEENQLLRERLSRQEDDFREAEAKLRRKLDEDKSRAKAKLAKVTKEKDAETERLIEKLRQAESASAEHRVEATRHRAEAERLRADYARSEERAEALDSRLGAVREESERQRDAARRELDGAKRDRDKAQDLMEELNRELESWRSNGGSGSGGGGGSGGGRERTSSAAELLSRYREIELLAKRLTQENKNLREQLEEAQAELLTRGLEEGRALLRRGQTGGSASLAAELETMTKDETIDSDTGIIGCGLGLSARYDPNWLSMSDTQLMDLLVKEKDACDKLRSYIDRILLRIMEQQPDLLEVGMLA